MRSRAKELGLKRGTAATGVLLLLVVAALVFVGGSISILMTRSPKHEHAAEAKLLLALSGLRNADEVQVLSEALEDGTLNYEAVLSALENEASKEVVMSATMDTVQTTPKASARNVAASTAGERTSQAFSDDDVFDNLDDVDDEDEIKRSLDPFENDLNDDLDDQSYEEEDLKRGTRRNDKYSNIASFFDSVQPKRPFHLPLTAKTSRFVVRQQQKEEKKGRRGASRRAGPMQWLD